MRFGCLGCFVLLLLVGVILAGGAVVIYLAGAIFDIPPMPQADYTPSDGHRAQQKLFELILRDSHRSSREDPVVITERELNAFLARHLEESEGIPLSPLVVKLSAGTIEVQGKTTLKHLLKGFPFFLLRDSLPASTVDRPVWVTAGGTIQLERRTERTQRRYGQLQVSEFSLGNQEMGPWLLSLLLGWPGQTPLRWQVPAVVNTITLEDGRLIIATRK